MPNPNELAPLTVIPGAIRFNTDSMKLEYYRGGPVGFGTTTQTGEWVNLTTDSPDIQTGGARGVFGGGFPTTSAIDYITISTTGNSTSFGTLTQARYATGACSSSTRGVFGGGQSPTIVNTIDYITIATLGNAQDFGDLTVARYYPGSCSSSTRGVFGGGDTPATPGEVNTIDYITISSVGNAVDFGDLTQARRELNSCSNGHGGL